MDGPVRRILHIDMDAFYASVEQRDDPRLRGKPVAVGGSPKGRGVVMAASYEARKCGVRSALPTSRAVRLCPELIVVPPDFRRYKEVSDTIFSIFRSVTALVEPLSLDEAYLDVTENAWGESLGVEVARRIKELIRQRTQLTASAGVAPNKFLAKIASGWRKPDGLTVVSPDRVESFLQKLPVDALWGVGPVTARKLREIGIERLVDVRRAPAETLRRVVGSHAETLHQLAYGIDDRPVVPDRVRQSISSEQTFAEDLKDLATLHDVVATLARETAEYLERKGLFARTVTLKLRYGDFRTITRSETRPLATRSAEEIAARALALLDKTEAGRRPIRLLGVAVRQLRDSPERGAPDKDPSPQLLLPIE